MTHEPANQPDDQDRRVLIVDDDPVFAASIVNILQSHGCSVAVAHSAEQARSVIQDFDAGVALVDIRLGSDNGLELIADLKQARPDICCVTISAYAELESAVRAVREGAYDYLRKPVAGSDLLATIERCFETVRLRGQRAAAEEALRASEERFRGMIKENADGIVVVDKAGVVLYLNPAAEQLFAVEADDVMGCEFWLPIVAGKTTEVSITGVLGKSGSAEIRVSQMQWDGKGACIVSLRDITARKRTEEALRIANAEMERKNMRLAELTETAQRFVDNVSHEFRTPLTVIKEFAGIIADGLAGPVSEDQAKYLGIIDNSVHDLAQMVDDLLDCSRLKAGTLRVDRRRCAAAEIMESVLPMLTSKAAAKNIELTRDITPEISDVFADREKAVRALVNLATNAIKYSPEDSDIVLWADESGDHGVRIGVTDNGPGMSEEDLAVIFGRFKQAGNGYRGSTKGLGLGLHIAKELTELNLGQIQVESEPGKGSIFWFSLPRCDWREIVHSYFDLLDEQEEDVSVSVLKVTPGQGEVSVGGVRGFLAAQCRPMDLILGEDYGDRLVLVGWTDVPKDWAKRLRAARDKVVSDDALAHVPEFRIEVVGTWRCPAERSRAETDTLDLLQGRKKSVYQSTCH